MNRFINSLIVPLFLGFSAVLVAAQQACRDTQLVGIKTFGDQNCGNTLEHWFPIFTGDGCHGWEIIGEDGAVTQASANGMTCNVDGSFSFQQYTGNVQCSGTSFRRSIRNSICGQDVPPFYSSGHGFSCCRNPDSQSCRISAPYVQGAAKVYENGRECKPSDSSPNDANTNDMHDHIVVFGLTAILSVILTP